MGGTQNAERQYVNKKTGCEHKALKQYFANATTESAIKTKPITLHANTITI